MGRPAFNLLCCKQHRRTSGVYSLQASVTLASPAYIRSVLGATENAGAETSARSKTQEWKRGSGKRRTSMHAFLLMFIKSYTVCEMYKFTFIVTCIQILQRPSEALSVFFRRGVFRHVQRVRPNSGPTNEGAHRPQNVGQQRDIFWPVRL